MKPERSYDGSYDATRINAFVARVVEQMQQPLWGDLQLVGERMAAEFAIENGEILRHLLETIARRSTLEDAAAALEGELAGVPTVTGTTTGDFGFTGQATETWVASSARTRQDLVLGALIVVVVCFIWINLATQPFPESLVEPLGAAIGYLIWRYSQLDGDQ